MKDKKFLYPVEEAMIVINILEKYKFYVYNQLISQSDYMTLVLVPRTVTTIYDEYKIKIEYELIQLKVRRVMHACREYQVKAAQR